MTIAEYLRQRNIVLEMPCGGNGTCGKCKVRIKQQGQASGEFQEVLACQTPYMGQEIEWQGQSLGLGGEIAQPLSGAEGEVLFPLWPKGEEIMAVDLGTTTIAVENISNGETAMGENPQRIFGQDVLSRVKAAEAGQGAELSFVVRQALKKLGERVHFQGGQVVIAGNTTMEHLFEGASVQGLGQYPFTPGDLSLHTPEPGVELMPGFSGFVGGDILSGVYALDMDQKGEISLLVDLGTNGEMVLGNCDGLYMTSTAAGPALEGGNIQYGMPGISGAISDVTVRRGFSRVETIDGEPARGICGSGVIAACSEMLRDGIIDRHGHLLEAYGEEGFPLYRRTQWEEVRFTQEDIRQVQLAKSAIRTGIELLQKAMGVTYDAVQHIYVAGGLGHALSVEKALTIGLLPREYVGRIHVVGNTSLEGAKKYARMYREGEAAVQSARERMRQIAALRQNEVVLANQSEFMELFLKYMEF